MDKYERIRKECKDMQDFLELTPQCEQEMVERLSTISVYNARSGKMLADMKLAYREERLKTINAVIMTVAKEGHLSAKVQNAMIDSIATDELYLIDWLDRINRACVHQGDNLRTMISYAKAQMQL